MEEREYRNVYVIPANYTDSGKLLGGMVETRNAVEAGALVLLVGYPELMQNGPFLELVWRRLCQFFGHGVNRIQGRDKCGAVLFPVFPYTSLVILVLEQIAVPSVLANQPPLGSAFNV